MFKVLVGCEESQAVTKSFRDLGVEAYSCDILKTSGTLPEFHIKGDVFEAIQKIQPLVLIAFPPCTFLSRAGGVRLFAKGTINEERLRKGYEAKEFFLNLLNSSVPYVAIENPTPLKIFELPKPSQVIEPYYFGEPYTKRTLLWLKNLPPLYYNMKPNLFDLEVTATVPKFAWVGANNKGELKGLYRSKKQRSKTFQGIAKAMAQQWTEYILNDLKK